MREANGEADGTPEREHAPSPAGDPGSGSFAALDDGELVRRCSRGDTDAFRELFERKHRGIYLTVSRIVLSPQLAEEVVQEVFLTLWKESGRYDPAYAVDTWLGRIATNRAIDEWRAQRRARRIFARPGDDRGDAGAGADASGTGGPGSEPPMPETDSAESSSALATGSDATDEASEAHPTSRARWREVQAIWDDLARELPPQQRAAFSLREIDGHDTREVAEILDCSVSTVRSHLSLARKRLRKGLRERYPEYLREHS